jgi:tetratricopeptide (TPR) repeat protein
VRGFFGGSVINQTENTELKQYLLGRLSSEDEERVEMRLLTEPEFAEEFDIAVVDLTDAYVAGEIQGEDRERAERYFFQSAERQNKLKYALALKAYKSQVVPARKWWASAQLRVAASILIVFGVFLGIWQVVTSESDLDKGMLALRAAYRDRRIIEPRISTLPHSPYSQTRGGAGDDALMDNLRLGELHLTEAVKDKPSAATHHALGQVYLAERRFDLALKEFEASLKYDQNNPQVYNDTGVALLEKASLSLTSSDNSPPTQQVQEELNRSLDNFNKALQLDPNLSEAIFNRALTYEKQKRMEEAKADWRLYLNRDSSSPWALEARRHLSLLEQ